MRFELTRIDRIGLFFFAAFIISTSLIWLFEERFDSDNWKSQPEMRYKMVDDIVEQKSLLGKTKEEVTVLLGEPSSRESIGKDIFLYYLGRPPSFFKAKREQLLVVFTDQKVVKVAITLD